MDITKVYFTKNVKSYSLETFRKLAKEQGWTGDLDKRAKELGIISEVKKKGE